MTHPEAAPFSKRSVADQVADNLRGAIARRVWEHRLPAERVLAEQLAVSRPLLRQALHRLRDEGILTVKAGQAARIVGRRAAACHPAARRRIVFLMSRPLILMGTVSTVTLHEVRRLLFMRGCRLEVAHDLRLKRKHPAAILRDMVRRYEADQWILASVPHEVQAWFQTERISTVVLGHTFPDIRLPSVDANDRVLARHAAGILLGLGHTRIACFSRADAAAGDLAMEEGFEEVFRDTARAAMRMVRHSGEVLDIQLRLKQLMSAPGQPTALFVSHAMDVLPILSALLLWGVRVPEAVSLISRQADAVFSRLTPSPAHYATNPTKLAADLVRLLDNPTTGDGCIRMLPPLVKGHTLARPP